MLKSTKNIVTVLDVCSSKIVCIIARIIAAKKYEIIGIGYNSAEGIKAGIISDINLAQQSIVNAVTAAEKMANIKASNVYVTISSNYLLSQHITTEMLVSGKEITGKDLNKLLLDAVQICKTQQLEVIHTFACNYVLDGHHGILNPIGMFGSRLSCKYHMLSVPSNNLLNLQSCIVKAGLKVENYVAGIYAAGLACLTKNETETSVMLIDFGAGATSFSIFENTQLIHADSISIGGNHITSDIAKVLCLPLAEAERIKNLYGGVIATDIDLNEMISVIDAEDNNQVSRAQLIDIIHARVDEILQIIQSKIKKDGIQMNNFVITGGVARTLRMKEFVSQKLSGKVRIGYPVNIEVLKNQSNSLEMATALGVLIHFAENILSNEVTEVTARSKFSVKSLASWIEKTFF